MVIFSIGEPPFRCGWVLKVPHELCLSAIPIMTAQQSPSLITHTLEDEVDSTTRSVSVEVARPKVLFSSPSVFLKSLWTRFASIWTKRFILSLLAGQLVALCVTCTDVMTTELVDRGWALPTTQTFFL